MECVIAKTGNIGEILFKCRYIQKNWILRTTFNTNLQFVNINVQIRKKSRCL